MEPCLELAQAMRRGRDISLRPISKVVWGCVASVLIEWSHSKFGTFWQWVQERCFDALDSQLVS